MSSGDAPSPLPLGKSLAGTLKTIGYTEEHALQRIETFLARPRCYLVDVRHKPFCAWNHYWDRTNLREVYKRRYVHLAGLGNRNQTKKGLPIVLADPDQPVRQLAEGLRKGNSYLLLCGCKRYETCHRKVVADLIMDALGLSHIVPELFIAVSLWE